MSAIAGTIETQRGWLEWEIIRGLCLSFVITFLLCLAYYIKLDNDFDFNETDNEAMISDISVSEITVTATPDFK